MVAGKLFHFQIKDDTTTTPTKVALDLELELTVNIFKKHDTYEAL